jgi:vanillate O-demethylase monooxygenase subunit
VYGATGSAEPAEYPADSSIDESDWHILAGFWHPVAFSSEVGESPFASRLLDVDLVVYRTNDGVAAARDLCVHRGSRLSLGWIDDTGDCLVCPFHGLHYDVHGQCTWIPANGDRSKAPPASLHLVSFLAAERYGIVWACLKPEPLRPLPEWGILEEHGPEWLSIEVPKGRWNTTASRHCENFNDIAHLSWVHMRTFGNRRRPEVPNYDLEQTDFGLVMALSYFEVERGFNDDLGERERLTHYRHELTYPFATSLRCDYTNDVPDEDAMTSYFFDIASPVGGGVTDVYQITLTNIPAATAEDYVNYQLVTNEEDVAVVESQRPEAVPLDLRAEMHIPADKFSIRYRRDLVEVFGLGSPTLVR